MKILNKLFASVLAGLNSAAATRTAFRIQSQNEHNALAAKLDALAEGQKVLSDMIANPKARRK